MTHTLLLKEGESADVYRVLSKLGIEYSPMDVHTTYLVPQARIMVIPDLDIHIFQVGDTSAFLIPLHIMDSVSPTKVRKRYFKFLTYWVYDQEIIRRFVASVTELIPNSIWEEHIPVVPLEDHHETMEIKGKKPQKVHVTSYLISKKHLAGESLTLHLNVRDIFDLCKNTIDSKHIVESLVPTASKDVLVTLFHDEHDHEILAMRTTSIERNVFAIKGSFACSQGYGRLIQDHTENLIRSNLHGYFTPSSHREKHPVYFTLNSLPSAKGFWKHIGFEETDKVDKEGHALMQKRLYPSDDESATTMTAKRSKI